MTKVCSVPVTRAMLQLIPGRWYESELGAWCGALGMAIGVTRAPEAPSGAQGPDEELDQGGLFTQVTVRPNGHFGLGIDEPLERLHVNGNVKAEGDCSCGEVCFKRCHCLVCTGQGSIPAPPS